MEKELIWVGKDIAKEYHQLESVELQEELVKKVILTKRIDIEGENELLNESLLRFKHTCLVHKNELEKVYKEQSEKLYKLWEEMGDVSSAVSQHAKLLSNEISAINKDISETTGNVERLRKSVQNINIYGSEKMVELAKVVASLDDATKTILGELLQRK